MTKNLQRVVGRTLRNNGTPQAKDDNLDVITGFEIGGSYASIGFGASDLMANDLGGRAKRFLGLGRLGESDTYSIQNVGTVRYDAAIDQISFQADPSFGGGPVAFEYAIQLGRGVVSSAIVRFNATVFDPLQAPLT